LDQWFERDIKPVLTGEGYIVRYADDFLCMFEKETDAKRFQTVLPKRLGRFSLELAPEKTKQIRFGRFADRDSKRLGEGAPDVFDFLGFTHYCGHRRAGKFKLKRRTAKKKFRAKLADMKIWLGSKLTTPISELWPTLNQKLQGHYQYYGINDNWPWLMKYLKGVQRVTHPDLANSYRTPQSVEARSLRTQGRSGHRHIPDISTLVSPPAAWPSLSGHTPCSALPSPTSTTTPNSSWLADERSRSDAPSGSHSVAHAAGTDE
jgi:hypothetical protein